MKKVLLTILIMAAAWMALSAQVVTDSTSFVTQNGTFLRVQKVEFADGRVVTDILPIGDSSAFKFFLLNNYQDEQNQLAAVERARLNLVNTRRILTEFNSIYNSVFGTPITTDLRETLAPSFVGTWRYREVVPGTEFVDVPFVLTPAGVTRFEFGGSLGNKTVRLLSNQIFTVLNFPITGTNTDFVRVDSNRFGPNSLEFRSTTGNYVLVKR
jgi:hypothetical protein